MRPSTTKALCAPRLKRRRADAASKLRGSTSDEEPVRCLELRLDSVELLAQPGLNAVAPALEGEVDAERVECLTHPRELALAAAASGTTIASMRPA